MEDLKPVGRAEFVSILNIEDPHEIAPCLELKLDGVWVVPPPDDMFLTAEERAALEEHPKQDLTIPALSFPCSVDELEEFLEFFCIDLYPSTALEDFKAALPQCPQPRTDKTPPSSKPRPKFTRKFVAEMYGVSVEAIKNWDNARNTPKDYPGRNAESITLRLHSKDYKTLKASNSVARQMNRPVQTDDIEKHSRSAWDDND